MLVGKSDVKDRSEKMFSVALMQDDNIDKKRKLNIACVDFYFVPKWTKTSFYAAEKMMYAL